MGRTVAREERSRVCESDAGSLSYEPCKNRHERSSTYEDKRRDRAHGDVEVQATQYPPTRKHAEEIVSFCRERGIRVSLSAPVGSFLLFGKNSTFENESGPADALWRSCIFKGCHFLYGHKLFFCVKCWAEETYFGQDMSGAFFDVVAGNENGWEILSAMERPFYVCGRCKFSYP